MSTLPDLLRRRMTSDATRTIMRRKDRGIWKPMNWDEFGTRVRSLVRAMQADGFGPAQRVPYWRTHIRNGSRPILLCSRRVR